MHAAESSLRLALDPPRYSYPTPTVHLTTAGLPLTSVAHALYRKRRCTLINEESFDRSKISRRRKSVTPSWRPGPGETIGARFRPQLRASMADAEDLARLATVVLKYRRPPSDRELEDRASGVEFLARNGRP